MNAIKSCANTTRHKQNLNLKKTQHTEGDPEMQRNEKVCFLFIYKSGRLQNFAWVSINLRCRVNKKANSNLQINCDNHY